MNEINKEDIAGIECKHVTYTIDKSGQHDLCLVKEAVHMKDGSIIKRLRPFVDYKRPFWIVKPQFRTFKDRREYIEKDKLQEFSSADINLKDSVIRALGREGYGNSLKQVCRNSYVFGTSLGAPVYLKHKYTKRYPNCHSPYDICSYDIETSVLHDDNHIILASITQKKQKRGFIVVLYDFIKDEPNAEKRFYEKLDELTPEVRGTKQYDDSGKLIQDGYEMKIEYLVVETESEIVKAIISKIHEWDPEVVTGWNISYDIDKSVEALKKVKIDPADVFSNPKIKPQFRTFRKDEDKLIKVSASGKKTTLSFQEQWNTWEFPAGWVIADAASVFNEIRKAKGKLASYALDAVLELFTKIRKLVIKGYEKYRRVDRHIKMQREKKIEYMVYNIWDNIGVEIINELYGDISSVMPVLLGDAELKNFKSNPQKLMADFGAFLEDKNQMVLGSTSDQMSDEFDKLTLPLVGWILTLKSFLLGLEGLNLAKDLTNVTTLIHKFVGDLDVKSSYPTTGIVANISKSTTRLEVCSIEGLNYNEIQTLGLNYVSGKVNAVELCKIAYKAPTFNKLLEEFKKVA